MKRTTGWNFFITFFTFYLSKSLWCITEVYPRISENSNPSGPLVKFSVRVLINYSSLIPLRATSGKIRNSSLATTLDRATATARTLRAACGWESIAYIYKVYMYTQSSNFALPTRVSRATFHLNHGFWSQCHRLSLPRRRARIWLYARPRTWR